MVFKETKPYKTLLFVGLKRFKLYSKTRHSSIPFCFLSDRNS